MVNGKVSSLDLKAQTTKVGVLAGSVWWVDVAG